MKVQIIGAVDLNNIDATTKKFIGAEIELMQQGYDVSNLVKQQAGWVNDKSLEAKLRMRLVAESDAVFVLPCWGNDILARHELALANTLNKRLILANGTILHHNILFTINTIYDAVN